MKQLAIDGGRAVIEESLPTIRDASGRLIGPEEMQLVREVMESGNLSYIYGTMVSRFESRFAERMGAEHAVAVSS